MGPVLASPDLGREGRGSRVNETERFMSQRQRLARVSGTLLLLFGAYVCSSQAKQSQESTPPAVDGRNRTAKIQAALDASELRCYDERRGNDKGAHGGVNGSEGA